jgi:hypothetical protein
MRGETRRWGSAGRAGCRACRRNECKEALPCSAMLVSHTLQSCDPATDETAFRMQGQPLRPLGDGQREHGRLLG